jgi:hypothetical protein
VSASTATRFGSSANRSSRPGAALPPLQTDWDPNNSPDGTVDHAMMVSGWDEVFGPYISQNTPHRQNIPLWLSMRYAQEQGKNNIIWYVART